MNEKTTAIIVAAGTGKRMKSDIPKQFIKIHEKPILYYTIKAFEESSIDDIIIVASEDYLDYVQNEIVGEYGFRKVKEVVVGGKERSDSVYLGIQRVIGSSYILVHDGARPFIRPELINQIIVDVKEKQAVIAAVPTKDTIKLIHPDGSVQSTPDRNLLWNIQTPQAFEYTLLKSSYEYVINHKIAVTDDAMAVEQGSNQPIFVSRGCYTNIKVTTPEDLQLAKMLLN